MKNKYILFTLFLASLAGARVISSDIKYELTPLSLNELDFFVGGTTGCNECDDYTGNECTYPALSTFECESFGRDTTGCQYGNNNREEELVWGPSNDDQLKSGSGNATLESGWCIKKDVFSCEIKLTPVPNTIHTIPECGRGPSTGVVTDGNRTNCRPRP